MKFITRLAINRGVFGGNRFFASIAIVLGLMKLAQRLSGTGPKTLYTHKLQDGEALVVTNTAKQ